MLQIIFEYFHEEGHWLLLINNMLVYISLRSAMAAVTALILGIVLGPWVIGQMKRLKIGQQIRGEGIPDLYKLHKDKAGTPTMGGVLILTCITISVLLWGNLSNRLVWLALFSTLWLGAIGFWDDWIKLRKKQYNGISKKGKILGQLLLGLILGMILYYFPLTPETGSTVSFPFFKNLAIPLGLFYIPFVMLILVSTSNAVNLTDGLDGLAIGCVIACASALGILTYIVGRTDFTAFLLIDHVPEAGELSVFIAALIGASLAFLWYNAHPAEIFMGDTGSLALGGALGAIAIFIKQEMLLPIIGAIFVIEALSVIIQVIARRRFDRKVFLMAPIHHHFQLLGWHESKIIIRFWIVSILLGIFGLATLKMR